MKLCLPGPKLCSRAAGAVLALGTMPALSGCGSMGMDGSMAAAQVRFVEISPGAPEMDFYVNGTGEAYGVGYANYTSYLPVVPGAVVISANRAGTGQTLGTAGGVLSPGRQYTAVVSHRLGGLQAHLFEDQDGPAPAGQMAMRVLNEVDAPGVLTVYVAPLGSGGTPPTVLNVPGGGASGYVSLPATGSYTVSATLGDAALRIPVSTVTVKATAGAVRTVVFGGVVQTGAHGAVGFALDDVE